MLCARCSRVAQWNRIFKLPIQPVRSPTRPIHPFRGNAQVLSRYSGTKSDPAIAKVSESLRNVLRLHPSSPVVLTAPISGHHGITLSSLTPLSITQDHEPLLTFNVRLPSRTYSLIQETRSCQINLLKANTKGASIAARFAQIGGANDDAAQLEGPQSHVDSDAVAAVLRCRLYPSELKVADHVIVVVAVEEVEHADPRHIEPGLCYAMGSYRRIGDSIGP